MAPDAKDRNAGALVGLAVGDALGLPVQFRERGSFAPVTGMRSGGPYNLPAGTWSDDTSLALCLATSLIERGGFDPLDQMERYLRWAQEGYLSPMGIASLDIGTTTSTALERYSRTREPWCGPTDEASAGNGSLMRLAPVPMYFAHDPVRVPHFAGESSRTTHGARAAVDACRYFGALVAGAIAGASKEELLAPRFARRGGQFVDGDLAPEVDAIACGSFKGLAEADVSSSGYVVHTLEAALWAFNETRTFEEGALLAVNLGDDADTVGAVYGQIAGAHYGGEAIPDHWRAALYEGAMVRGLADRLFDASASANG